MSPVPPGAGDGRAARAALTCCLLAGFATLLDATVVAYAAPTVASSRDAVVGEGSSPAAPSVRGLARRGAARSAQAVLPVVSAPRSGGRDSRDTGRMTLAQGAWSIERVAWSDDRAVALRAAMDDEIAPRYAEVFASFDDETAALLAQDFAVDPATIVEVVLVLDARGEAVGHAALRALGDELEVKRVFVHRHARGNGASRALMAALEDLALARGASRLILQTGDRQPEAIALYECIGYHPIETFPPYVRFAASRCFAKTLTPASARS